MKNFTVKNIKDLNEYKGIKDIRYLFNDNIYNGIIDITFLFNEDYYIEKLDSKTIKSEFKKLSKNLVVAYARDITYTGIILIKVKNLQKDPLT